MVDTPIKPNFPPVPEDYDFDYYEYLASLGFTVGELKLTCLVEADVVGVDHIDNGTVSIRYNDITYSDIPVWVHTDQGARLAIMQEEEESFPIDYFRNAARMFVFPEGCTVQRWKPSGFSWTPIEGRGIQRNPYSGGWDGAEVTHAPLVRVLARYEIVEVDDEETLEVVDILGVVEVIQNMYWDFGTGGESYTRNYNNNAHPQHYRTLGFPTYRPYIMVQIRGTNAYNSTVGYNINDYEHSCALYDLITGEIAIIPNSSYTELVDADFDIHYKDAFRYFFGEGHMAIKSSTSMVDPTSAEFKRPFYDPGDDSCSTWNYSNNIPKLYLHHNWELTSEGGPYPTTGSSLWEDSCSDGIMEHVWEREEEISGDVRTVTDTKDYYYESLGYTPVSVSYGSGPLSVSQHPGNYGGLPDLSYWGDVLWTFRDGQTHTTHVSGSIAGTHESTQVARYDKDNGNYLGGSYDEEETGHYSVTLEGTTYTAEQDGLAKSVIEVAPVYAASSQDNFIYSFDYLYRSYVTSDWPSGFGTYPPSNVIHHHDTHLEVFNEIDGLPVNTLAKIQEAIREKAEAMYDRVNTVPTIFRPPYIRVFIDFVAVPYSLRERNLT